MKRKRSGKKPKMKKKESGKKQKKYVRKRGKKETDLEVITRMKMRIARMKMTTGGSEIKN